MKKIYALFVVCFFLTTSVTAQTFYWIGPNSGAGGAWNNNANWSATSGGPALPLGQFPNSASHDVIFDRNALVDVNVANIDLSTLTVTGNSTAKLFVASGSGVAINLLSTSNVNQSLKINTGSRLEDSCDINVPFTIAFGANAKGLIDGTWYFAGRSTVLGVNGATFSIPALTGLSNRIDVNGTVQFRNNTLCPNPATAQSYVFFNAGSTFWLDRNAGNTLRATWAPTSTINVTGVTTQAPTIVQGTIPYSIGNLVFNCANMTSASIGWTLNPDVLIGGDLSILNTNARLLTLATNGAGGPINIVYSVAGNFNVSGSSRVILASANAATKVVTFDVAGNLNMSGTSLDLQSSNLIVDNPTVLRVGGNISHTAGTIGASSNSVSTTTDLYVIELDGTVNQNISSTGTIDNANNELSLRINNTAGVTLTSPVSVGKLSFNTVNKGKVTTTNLNVLTVNNTGTHALVVNSPSSTGFVNGPVRRRTSVVTDYLLPTGKASTYDPIMVRPSSISLSVYQAEYFPTAFSDLSVVSPLNGVSSQEYWSLSTISGADAAVTLTLTGAVPGATATDGIAVSHYNGIDWTDYSAGGTTITPGNSTTGSARSLITTQNGVYTFGFGLAGSLPIKLLSFDARKNSGSSAQVSWTISSNSNANKFEVLRSTDGRVFTSIGTVNAIDRQYAYGFGDNSLPSGTSYYRLKMTDKDGIVTYSAIVAVMNGSKGVLITSMIPTVVRSGAIVNISSSEKGTMQLFVTDMYGRIVKKQLASIANGNQQVALELGNLPAGAYQVSGFMNGQQVGTIRFVRQ